MKYWCTDCVVSGIMIYGALKYGMLSTSPEMMTGQIILISMASKPVTHMVMSQMESLGLKTM